MRAWAQSVHVYAPLGSSEAGTEPGTEPAERFVRKPVADSGRTGWLRGALVAASTAAWMLIDRSSARTFAVVSAVFVTALTLIVVHDAEQRHGLRERC